jgi:hypothetical protein
LNSLCNLLNTVLELKTKMVVWVCCTALFSWQIVSRTIIIQDHCTALLGISFHNYRGREVPWSTVSKLETQRSQWSVQYESISLQWKEPILQLSGQWPENLGGEAAGISSRIYRNKNQSPNIWCHVPNPEERRNLPSFCLLIQSWSSQIRWCLFTLVRVNLDSKASFFEKHLTDTSRDNALPLCWQP